MRLTPGITLAAADDVLFRAETTWKNTLGATNRFGAYIDAVHDTYPMLKQAFAAPDLGAGLRTGARSEDADGVPSSPSAHRLASRLRTPPSRRRPPGPRTTAIRPQLP